MTSANTARVRFSWYPGGGFDVLRPVAQVTVIMAMTMSPKRASPARRERRPRAIAMPPPNSINAPSTAKSPPGCRCATFDM